MSKRRATSKSFAFPILLAMLIFILPNPAVAQSYKHGYHFYVRGQYSAAERAFQEALTRAPGMTERARLHKWLGICQYMLGKRQVSAINLRAALKINPRTTISKAEVNDETIISFFNDIRGQSNITTTTKIPTDTSIQSSATIIVRSKDPQRTGRVFLNGVLSGELGQKLKTPPGVKQVTIILDNGKEINQNVNAEARQVQTILLSDISTDPNSSPQAKQSQSHEVHATKLQSKPAVRTKKKPNKSTRKIAEKKRRIVRKKKSASPAQETAFELHSLLPFGIPQFLTNQQTTGALYAIGQFSSFAVAVQKWQEGDRIALETNRELAEREAAREQLSEEEAQKNLQGAIEYQKQQSAASNSAYDQAMLFSGIGISLWVASSIQQHLFTKQLPQAHSYPSTSQYPNSKLTQVWYDRPLLLSKPDSTSTFILTHNLEAQQPTLSLLIRYPL
ncbi:MAG: tetratricopeptide repeat protein [Zetaproteobacteria bacterium]|nr:tetratricopeptide repeat protein [Zetaproteobacteria bacterium]